MKNRLLLLLVGLEVASSACALAAAEPRTLKGSGPVSAVRFSPDGKRLASGGSVPGSDGYQRGEVILWDLVRGDKERVLAGNPGEVRCLAFSPDGKVLVSGGCRQPEAIEEAQNIKVWDVATGKELATLLGQGDEVVDVAFSPDGKALASAGMDGTVKLRLADRQWPVRATLKPPTRKTREQPAFSLAFDHRGRWLAVGLMGGAVEIWDLATLKLKHTLHVHDVKNQGVTVAISPDGTTLASVAPDGVVQFWDTESFQNRRTFQVGIKPWPLAFSPDNRLLAVGESQEPQQPSRVVLWDLGAGKQVASLEGHKGAVSSLVISRDGQVLVSGSYDATVKLWPMVGSSVRCKSVR